MVYIIKWRTGSTANAKAVQRENIFYIFHESVRLRRKKHKWEGKEEDNVAFFVLFNTVFFFTYVVSRLWRLHA